ncbi:MAG: mechanosensitive ion channel [Pirellulaceae bacterium]|nr:mechanosensitive ion channel [Pirellulaceae bacterium]
MPRLILDSFRHRPAAPVRADACGITPRCGLVALFAVCLFVITLPDAANAQTPVDQSQLIPNGEPKPSLGSNWALPDDFDPPAVDPKVRPASFTGEQTSAAATTPNVDVSKEAVAKELSAIEAATDLTDELREEIKERLRKANDWLDGEIAAKKRFDELETIVQQLPTQLQETRKTLADFSDAEFQVMPSGKTVAELEGQLATLRQQLESDEKLFRDREAELEGRTSRLTALAKETVEIEGRIAKLRPQIEATKVIDPASRSQLLEQRARLRLREQELVTSKFERRRIEESSELLPLQRDLAKRIWTSRQKMLVRWQTAIDDWRKAESKRQADLARRIVEDAHPALKSLAEENAQIAEQRLKTAAEIQRLTTSIKSLQTQSKDLDEDFKDLSSRVEHAGTTSTTGLLLRKKRGELPRPIEFTDRAEYVQSTMPDAHLLLLQWKRQRLEVVDPEEAATLMVQSLDASLANADPNQVMKIVVRLMEDRRSLLDNAIPDQDTFLQDLNELELANQKLQKQVTDFRQYLNQRVLWIRSTNAIALRDFHDAGDGLKTMLAPARWQEVVQVGGLALLKRPAVGLGLLATLILLMIFRVRLHASQRAFSEPPPAGQPSHFGRYLVAFSISLLLSARWPAVLLAIGYRLRIAGETASWTENVGNALITSVAFLWGCELIRELCRRDAVGERVFGWPAKATAKVRSTLELTTLAGTPLFALLQLTQFGEVDAMQSLQRVLFIALLTLLGVQLAWLTRPKGCLMTSLCEVSPTSLVARARHGIWATLTAAPLAFVILSMIGYHFSAYQLSGHLAESGAALVGIIILYSLALCWLHVLSYNRALRDAELAAQLETSDLPLENNASTVIEGVVFKQSVGNDAATQPAVDDEVRELLRHACWILLIVGGWFIWSETLPALRVFDHVVLWQNIEPIAETFVRTDGSESIRFVDQSVPTTLTDVFVALLICLSTLMIGRRIPGVLELIVLEHLPMQAGGRQAVAIIARYIVTVAGMLLACAVIRLSWGSVQWLAAAMTVGLGFGLQEIFANLVSGLIILVERPIRVGDIVSVGDVTGTVTKMQMRATTVTDYDRRELIVPNKKFITDNVINWTLSDPISRVVLPVGVAYGTDVTKVREILLRIAAACPFVLDEPPPNTLFKSFGDSTLNVQLMVFIPQRSVYVDVVNELNNAIANEFGKAGIQIAFPQLDLHVKPERLIEQLAGQPDAQTDARSAA